MVKVKICGITNIKDALLCESLGADALGFIFYRKSKRFIEPEKAVEIIKKLSPFTIKVGVFVNESLDTINRIAAESKINIIQLHGEEDPDLLKRISLPAIKSFRINNGFDFSVLQNYPGANYLLDAYSESEYGGTGRTFNWKFIPAELKNKIILAGGISSENIEEICSIIKPAAVDLSSSIESEPGKKDKEKTKEFFYKLKKIRR